jgi:hypothetical protein
MSKRKISRRLVLQGAGVSLLLPWLESVPVWGGAEQTESMPKRFACLFIGDGISPSHWWAEDDGDQMKLGPSLTSLEPFKRKLNVISGLFNRNAQSYHVGCTGNILTGARMTKGRSIRNGVSMDQLLARHFQDVSPLPSLVLGAEQPMAGFHETQFSMVYASHISWENEHSPVPMELSPSAAFDAMFGNHGNQRQLSVLDRVLDQANSLRQRVSQHDQLKLDEYLSSVREIERRVRRSDADDRSEPRQDIAGRRPANDRPADLGEYMRLMCDMIVLAFETNKTRIATLLLARDISGHTYPFVSSRSAHHQISHSCNGADFQKIVKFHVEHYAYLLRKLDSLREGERTVLDNSCLVFVSEHWGTHDSGQVPLLLAGGLGGTLRTGRTLNYRKSGDNNRMLCSLYLSIMDRMGLERPSFGDATTRLAGL